MKFVDELEALLKKDQRFVAEDGRILKPIVYDACMSCDAGLLSLLLSHSTMKEHFFTFVGGTSVFNQVKFSWVLDSREFLPDSYTMFKNKIGLADRDGKLISQKRDVTLVWPYKDCVLEGGQTKEDQKRDEIFYNETLAPDEVNRLLEPKVLVGAKRYTADGVEECVTFGESDNLVIKGNNLLAIASLLKRFEGRVKCIYIDPPYNTGNDTFSYNDKFTRATWLVFMKTRLEIARRLLHPEGAIYVQLDYHQVHYAKILMDEIFCESEDNFQREIIWRIGWLSGYKTIENNYIRNHDTILFYSKDSVQMKKAFNKNYIHNALFKKPIKDVREFISDAKSLGVDSNAAKKIADTVNEMPERYPIEDVWNGSEYDDLNSIAIVSFAGETVSKMLNPTDGVKGQKSEKLVERIIQSHTKDESDIVLDFFGGTGTTAAVAMKMKRRFIICEQLDMHIDIALRRLEKVMDGEQSGVSKAQNWQGGGSFVYCELMERNESIACTLQNLKTRDEVHELLNVIMDNGLLKPTVIPDELRDNLESLADLKLDDLKRLVMDLIDMNKLYVNLCDIDDEEMNVKPEDKEFTKNFYSL